MLRIIRPADLFVADFELSNLRLGNGSLFLVDPHFRGEVVVRLPPQHIAEPIMAEQGLEIANPAYAAAGATLTYRIEDRETAVAAGLLDWGSKTFEPWPDSVIEFPNRLRLSPDNVNGWRCRPQPFTHEGRTELWSARYNGNADIRAFDAVTGLPARQDVSPADEDVGDLVRLTSGHLPDLSDQAIITLIQHGVSPAIYNPEPFEVGLLILTPLGATVRMKGSWDYPYGGVDPALLASVGLPPPPQITAYDHVAATGRDQYVRIVKRGFLSTGHRASVVEVVRRDTGGPFAELVKSVHVVPVEAELDYTADHYPHQGREMPFRRLRIVDPISPDVGGLGLADRFDWIGDPPFAFTMVGTDMRGNEVSFRLPQMFFPDSMAGRAAEVVTLLQQTARWQVPLDEQVVALGTERDGDPSGATSFPVNQLGLTVTAAGNALGFLPMMESANVRVPAVERLTGKVAATAVAFDDSYLNGVSDAVGTFLTVPPPPGADTPPLRADFTGDLGGGLARPSALIGRITTRAGAIPALGALKAALDQARLLGSIPLADLLGAADPDAFPIPVDPQQVEAALNDARHLLPVPLLRAQDLADGTHEIRYLWRPALTSSPPVEFGTDSSLTLHARVVRGDGSAQPLDATVTGELCGVTLAIGGLVRLSIGQLRFEARYGHQPQISASGFILELEGALAFVQTLRDALPADGFSRFPAIEAGPDGISAGYSLSIPTVGVGVFSMHNFALATSLHVPFTDDPFTFRFAIAERQHPCTLTVAMFGGGAYFALTATGAGLRQVEAAIEFGGAFSLDLGVASGGVSVMAGIYISWTPSELQFAGYLRAGGQLEVLGLIAVSVEFYLELRYREDGPDRGKVAGQASVTIGVRVLFFSRTVTLTVHRCFAGAAGDPAFDELVDPADWAEYCGAFA